jgi:hypothetical protein
MSDASNIKAAQEVHHKLEFYLVALAFTTAAFATQTGKFSGNILGDLSEISSWLLLVLSGLIGLWRLERIPVAYRTYEYVKKRKITVEEYKEETEYADSISALKSQIAEFEPELKRIEAGNLRRYFWQKLFLVAGLMALLLARLINQTKGLYW